MIDEDLLERFTASLAGNPGDPEALPISSDDVIRTSIHHENWPMPNGNILTLSTTFHDLTPEQRATFCPDDPTEFGVIGDVVVEFETSGRVVRTWDLWDAVDVEDVPRYERCADTGPFASEVGRDWMHANAVAYDEVRDVVIVSARHTNQVIALDHGERRDPSRACGGSSASTARSRSPASRPATSTPSRSRRTVRSSSTTTATTGPGATVRDPDDPMYSRAVLYAAGDPADWTVNELWEHVAENPDGADDPDGPVVYARFLGDADRLSNGNVLITHGGIDLPEDEDFQHAVVIEVEPDGTSGGVVVWEFLISSAEEEVTIYRSERIPTFHFGPGRTPRD